MFNKPNNPWLFAACIAVGCMFLDDLPSPIYNTFSDPGAAAMLSVILADATIVAIRRGKIASALVAFLPALVLKFFIQPLFWVRNAAPLDIGTLTLAHALLAALAVRNVTWQIRFQCAATAFGFVLAAVIAAALISGGGESWLHFYIQVSATRVLVPLAFWFAVLRVERESKKSV